MKNIFKIATASIVALAMLAFPADVYSQGRSSGSRSSSSSSARSSSVGSSSRSSSSTRSSSPSYSAPQNNNRSSASSSRSSASQNRSSSTQSRSSATQSRSTASQSRSSSTPSYSTPQNNNRSSASSSRSSASQSRSSATQNRSTEARVARPIGNSSTRSSASRSANAGSAREQNQRVGNATRNGLTAYDGKMDRGGNGGSDVMRENRSDFMRIGEDRNVHRIPPRERDFMAYDRPGHFWGAHPHFYGYRVNYLPPSYRRLHYWGVDYCFYNGIYYRPYNDWWVICRPPYGICIEAAITDLVFSTVRFAYYNNTYRLYRAIDSNNRIIDEQNRIIAQNNATIAAQNSSIALNTTRANDAYTLANRLGLAQSYAYANQPYYYQDGVFYIVNSNGQYEVIVPPSGALVEELPDDYDIITLDGMEFYKVDDTVYRTTLVGGKPYLEVLGQMYGDMARKYNLY